MKKSVLEIVNDKIISELENGINPWVKPWIEGLKSTAYNAKSNNYYNGINQFLLKNTCYMTFKQIQDLGGKLKKGAKSEIVIFSKEINKTGLTETQIAKLPDEERIELQKQMYYCLNYYNVFNCEDIENLDSLEVSTKTKEIVKQNNGFKAIDNRTIEKAEEIIKNYAEKFGLTLFFSTCQGASYSPLNDTIVLPYSNQFNNIAEYYSTVFHELAHSTGYVTRLNRDIMNSFGNEKYSKEELIAEITAVLCLNYLGIDSNTTTKNSAAYLRSWAEHIKEKSNTWLVISATAQAEKAFKMICNIEDSSEDEAA